MSHRSVLVPPIRRECQRLDRSHHLSFSLPFWSERAGRSNIPFSCILFQSERDGRYALPFSPSHFSPTELGGLISHSPILMYPISVPERWELGSPILPLPFQSQGDGRSTLLFLTLCIPFRSKMYVSSTSAICLLLVPYFLFSNEDRAIIGCSGQSPRAEP